MKKIMTYVLALSFVLLCTFSSFAGAVPFMEDASFQDYVAKGTRIFDAADLLTPEQEADIQEKLSRFESTYGQPAIIVTDNSQFSSQEEADALVDGMYAASGAGTDGIMLYVTGKPAALIYGSGEAERYLTDKAQDQIFDSYNGGIWTPMANGDYYTAFSIFTGAVSDLYAQGVAQNQVNYNQVTGETDPYYPAEPENKPFLRLWQIIVSLLGAAGISVAPVSRVKSQYAMQAEKVLSQGVSLAYRKEAAYTYGGGAAASLIDRNVKRQFIPAAQQQEKRDHDGGPSFGGGQTTIRPSQGGGTHTSSGRGF